MFAEKVVKLTMVALSALTPPPPIPALAAEFPVIVLFVRVSESPQ